jgi:hypothetical protein
MTNAIWLAATTSTTADARDERRPRKREDKKTLNLFLFFFFFFLSQNSSYVAAAYVKWIEAAGGRAVPIRFYVSDGELRRLFDSINGLILPGEELKAFFFSFVRCSFFFSFRNLAFLLSPSSHLPLSFSSSLFPRRAHW